MTATPHHNTPAPDQTSQDEDWEAIEDLGLVHRSLFAETVMNFWLYFRRISARPMGIVALTLLGFWIFAALFCPLLAPFHPNDSYLPFAFPLDRDESGHLFLLGTDHLGRDILSRLLYGARRVLFLAPAATAAALVSGTCMGLLAGYLRGWVDDLLSFVANFILSFPILVLYVVIIATFGASAFNLFLAITFASAPGIMRIVRGLTLDLSGREYIHAAEARGESRINIMVFEILPNISGPLITDTCLRLGYTVITIGTLGFLGFGIPPPDPDWGGMISETRAFAIAFPHMALYPCLALASLVLGFNLLADAIREAAQEL